jgi:hypothetical protein
MDPDPLPSFGSSFFPSLIIAPPKERQSFFIKYSSQGIGMKEDMD